MKLYISADIEGVAGVVNPQQIGPDGGAEYQRARLQMTREINSVIEAALSVGVTEIVVNDGHANHRNILLDELNEEAILLTGSPKPLGMMEGISASFDAAVFVGYHSRAGSAGTLSHTMSGGVIANIRVNGKIVGETAINAALAGYFNVPIILITGDNQVAEEAIQDLGDVETVIVKEFIWNTAARCIHPNKALRRIRDGATRALENIHRYKPLVVDGPVTIEVDFLNRSRLDMALRVPDYEQVGDLTVRRVCHDYLDAYKRLRVLYSA